MYKRILVAVDDSDISRNAMKSAISLAKDLKATLCILYVADEFLDVGEGIVVDFKKHEEDIRKKGRTILKEMEALAKKAKVKSETRMIEIIDIEIIVSEIIVEQADKWKADLIMMGTHGRTGLKRLLMGSVAEEVMKKTSVPVQIVREKSD